MKQLVILILFAIGCAVLIPLLPVDVTSDRQIIYIHGGEPVLADFEDTGLKVVVNANWPMFQDPASGAYYLLNRDLWLTSSDPASGWQPATTLPAGFETLPTEGEHAAIRQAVPLTRSSQIVPDVIYVNRPAELIVTDGVPRLEAIPGAGGLEYVSNTASPLFRLEQTWYFLVAGRWFTTANPEHSPWRYTTDLPAAFARGMASGTTYVVNVLLDPEVAYPRKTTGV